jgi:hypothetical protein
MTNESIAEQLKNIQGQLDVISAEIEERKRYRLEMEELKGDLTVIAKDVFQTAVVEFEDIAPFVKTGDFLHLLKKILRNMNAISATISKLESAVDFFEDAKPIGQDFFCTVLHKFEEMEQKGYFRLMKEFTSAFDQVVSKLSEDDMKRLSENMVGLVGAMKILVDANLLTALGRTAEKMRDMEPARFDKFNPWTAHRVMSQPEMRRAAGLAVHFLKTFVSEINNNNHLKEN